MQSLSVAAVVVSHGQPDYLSKTLSAVAAQSFLPYQTLVVETSSDAKSLEIARQFGVSIITPGDLRLGAALNAGIAALKGEPQWVWLLHDDSWPELDALEHLAKTAEISPTVGIVGPKLLQADSPILIQQMGLTLTPTGRPFLVVENAYDQGQFDADGDVLAVSTAGMLVSRILLDRVGGLDDSTPVFGQDIELGLRARAAGFRVILEASARVHHIGLSQTGGRSKHWLGGTRIQALSKAHLHLATLLLPTWILLLTYLALPLLAVAAIPINLLAKRPKRSIGQFAGWIWAWRTIPQRFAARAKLQELGSLRGAKALFATPTQIRRRRLEQLEEAPEVNRNKLDGLLASNQAWFGLVPLIGSVFQWPRGALSSEKLAPLSATFSEVFDSVAAQVIFRGDGLAAPADPYNFFLALISFISPLGPSLGFASFVFLAPTIAYFSAWKLSSIFVSSPWARTLVALGYAFSPFVLGQAATAGVVELTAAAFAPISIYFLVNALKAFNAARAWRWTGLAGLALGIVAVSSPISFALTALIVIVGVFHFRNRTAVAIWAFAPGVTLLYPWVSFWLQQGNWPLITATSYASAGPFNPVMSLSGLAAAMFLAFAVLGFTRATNAQAAALGSAILIGFSTYLIQPAASSAPSMGLGYLAALILLGIFISSAKRLGKSAISVLLLSGVVAKFFLTYFWLLPAYDYVSQRQLPALIVTNAQVSEDPLLTLKVEIMQGEVNATLVWDDGLALEEASLASRYLATDFDKQATAELVARLVAGNPSGATELIESLGVDFVLVNSNDPELLSEIEVGISSMEFLQTAGQSDFGLLWQSKVSSDAVGPQPKTDPFRAIQLGVLAGYLLLALPTPAAIRGTRRLRRGGA